MKVARWLLLMTVVSCQDTKDPIPSVVFDNPKEVTVLGYKVDLMEPFLSRDGKVLLFNNSNAEPNTSLHWATRVDDGTFTYQGMIGGVDTNVLEGVPSMDATSKLYFVSTRDYEVSQSTIFSGFFLSGSVATSSHVLGLPALTGGSVNFDVEVSKDGETLYFAKGVYTPAGGPFEADLVIAKKDGNGNFQIDTNSDKILANVNSDALEYGAAISSDNLELYFTRMSGSTPSIWVATRSSVQDVFGEPTQLTQLTGFVEAPTLSPDGGILYYHRRNNDGVFQLWMATRTAK